MRTFAHTLYLRQYTWNLGSLAWLMPVSQSRLVALLTVDACIYHDNEPPHSGQQTNDLIIPRWLGIQNVSWIFSVTECQKVNRQQVPISFASLRSKERDKKEIIVHCPTYNRVGRSIRKKTCLLINLIPVPMYTESARITCTVWGMFESRTGKWPSLTPRFLFFGGAR